MRLDADSTRFYILPPHRSRRDSGHQVTEGEAPLHVLLANLEMLGVGQER